MSLKLDPWDEIIDEAFRKCQSQYDNKVNELMEVDNDISDAEAMEDGYRDMKNAYRMAMMNSFGSKLLWFNAMKKGSHL